MEGITMLGKPKYKLGDWVKFEWQGETIEGEIWQVDAYGTFFQTKEPSYEFFHQRRTIKIVVVWKKSISRKYAKGARITPRICRVRI